MALIEQMRVKDAIDSISVAGGAVNPATSDKQNQEMVETVPQGTQGPIQQREQSSGAGGYPETELTTFDTNLETILGNQPLTNNGRLKVEDQPIPEVVIQGVMGSLNQEVKINLSGMSTLVIQTQGTWAGTLSFFGSIDGQAWNAINGLPLNGAAFATTTTTQGIWRFLVAGLLAFKVQFTAYTSGTARAILVATPVVHIPSVINASLQASGGTSVVSGTVTATTQGSNATTVLQNFNDTTNGRLIVQDNGYIKDALQYPDPWNSFTNYYTGDTVSFNGLVYVCLQFSAKNTANNSPLTVANWAVDARQYKSVVTKADLMAPNESRMKIQLDYGQYNRQLAEQQVLVQSAGYIIDMLTDDAMLSCVQDYGGSNGKKFYIGGDSSSHYLFDEVR